MIAGNTETYKRKTRILESCLPTCPGGQAHRKEDVLAGQMQRYAGLRNSCPVRNLKLGVKLRLFS
jgi:hypothetical protein